MPITKNPELPVVFRGIDLSGNPVRRPSMTASVAKDVRVMPGGWIRLRGGRKAKSNTVGGTVMQIHSFYDPNFPGSNSHMAQIKYAGAGTANWTWFDLATYTINPFGIQSINLTHDSSHSLSNPAAIANVTDRPVFYNGLGRRDGTDSRPPLSSYFGGVVRYFGLDAYCPSGTRPTVSFAAGAGNNAVATSVQIWVGIYHEPTGHYSNAVDAGQITTTAASGTITVSNLARLVGTWNNVTEQGELKYVFYATIDGYQVPYLIMNAAHTGPLTAAITATTQSLSVETATIGTENGWFLDKTSEAPTNNFPPRPMKCLCAVNGRLYGIPLSGGSGTGSDFKYPWDTRDLASVVWSKAPGDDRETKLVGDPQQCWPLTNKKATPNIQTPVWLAPSLSEDAVLVWTPKSLFLMQELSNGLHIFTKISAIHGIKNPMSIRVTDYGICWVDQRNQICMLDRDDRSGIRVISRKYQEKLVGKTVTCADYILDPPNEIDRYQVWFSDGTTVCHDFTLRDEIFPDGQAYTGTNQDFTAAQTLTAQDGTRHYVVAKGGFYTQEAQPDNSLIPTTDQTFANAVDQTVTETEVIGEYIFNWDRITDWNQRKTLPGVFLIGDGKASTQLGSSPLRMKWWGDFEVVPGGAPATLVPTIVQQTATDWQYRFAPTSANRYLFKIGFTIAGHSGDDAAFVNHRRPAQEGDLAKNFYGSICEAAVLIGSEGNRPT
jgi:hypothetical protein